MSMEGFGACRQFIAVPDGLELTVARNMLMRGHLTAISLANRSSWHQASESHLDSLPSVGILFNVLSPFCTGALAEPVPRTWRVHVERNLAELLSSQELEDRTVVDFAADIPGGDVNATDSGLVWPVGVLQTSHLPEELFDLQWVLAQEHAF